MTDQVRSCHASLEGISGCGKSYILSLLREALGSTLEVIEEFDNREKVGQDQTIATALRSAGDQFFRGGHPYTETLLLLAIKTYDAEARITPALAEGRIAIEDRSIDTIAVYQSLVLYPSQPDRQLDATNRLFEFACQWRNPPQVTFLLADAFDTCLERAQQRSVNAYSPEEIAFLRRAADLYDQYAAQPRNCERILRLDRRHMNTTDIVHFIRERLVSPPQERNDTCNN